jgi:hypothetical protein
VSVEAWRCQGPPSPQPSSWEGEGEERARGPAGFVEPGHVDMLIIAGHLRYGDELPGARQPGQEHANDSDLEWEVLHEFRTLPVEYRADAVEQVKWIARLVKRKRYRIIGDEEESDKP